MMTPKKLNFSSPARVDEDDDHTDATLLTRQRKAHPTSDQQEEPKEKKEKKEIKIWNEDDELIILKGLVEFRAREGNDTEFDWDGFYSFIKDLIQVPKKQVFKKIRELHKEFLDIRERINNGINPHFMKITETEAFKASTLLWEINDDADKCSEDEEDEEDNVDAEPVNDNEAAKTNADDELVVPNENQSGEEEPHDDEPGDNNVNEEALQELVDKITENKDFGKKMPNDNEAGNSNAANGELVQETVVDTQNTTVGEESHDDDLLTLQEAFDTTPISQGLPEYLKKLQRNKLMTLNTQNRKELSDGWKEICSEQTRLTVKRFRFSAKLVEAANDG